MIKAERAAAPAPVAALSGPRYLSVALVCEKFSCKKTWLYDIEKADPSFPRALQLGPARRWIEAELDAWMVSVQLRHRAATTPRRPGRPPLMAVRPGVL